jgi:hypothetical protein
MKIVAFLQNPWFPPGTKKEHVDKYTTDQRFHRRLLANTMSGRRLLEAFGEDTFKEIWWDNVSPDPAWTSAGVTSTVMAHVERVLREQDPDLILVFGLQAKQAVSRSVGSIKRKVMACHHPNARFKTQEDLNKFALDVRIWRLEQEIQTPHHKGFE